MCKTTFWQTLENSILNINKIGECSYRKRMHWLYNIPLSAIINMQHLMLKPKGTSDSKNHEKNSSISYSEYGIKAYKQKVHQKSVT